MNDEDAIRNLLASYCFAIDDGDLDAYAELFAEGVLSTGGLNREPKQYRGREQVRRNLDRVVLYDGSPCTKHLLNDISIVVDGDSATARSYFTLMQTPPGATAPLILLMGNYFDTFTRRADRWGFAERVVRTDFIGDTSTHLSTFQ